MKVANMTAIATTHGLTCFCSMPLLRVDRRCDRHAGPEYSLWILAFVQDDLHRHPLDHLDEVAGRVFRRQQAESGAGGRGDAIDLAGEGFAAVGVHFDSDALPWPHAFELGLLEVRRDPDRVERHDRHQWLAGLNDLPGLDRLAADDTARRRLDRRILEIQFRLFHGST